MSNFTQLCMETNCFHECLVVFLPERISFHISSDDYAFHVICKNVLRNAHVNKRMNHTNKQVFLSGIWKEFNVSLATMMTDHGETCTLIRTTVRSIYFNKSPSPSGNSLQDLYDIFCLCFLVNLQFHVVLEPDLYVQQYIV